MPTQHKALFFDDDGVDLGEWKVFNPRELTFNYENKAYNIDETSAIREHRRWRFIPFFYVREYHYYLNNPNPIKYGKMQVPIMSPHLYKLALEVDFVRQLQMLSKGNDIDWKRIFKWLIILGGIGLLVYFLFFNHPKSPVTPTQLFMPLFH